MTSIFTENVTLPQVFFRHFASKNQLPGFYIKGALVGNMQIYDASILNGVFGYEHFEFLVLFDEV